MPTVVNAPDKQAYANGTVAPLASDVQAALVGKPNVTQAYNADKGVLLMGEMGALNSATDGKFHDYESSLHISSSSFYGAPSLGLLSSAIGGSFADMPGENLTFIVTGMAAGGWGTSTFQFGDLNAAQTFFSDHVISYSTLFPTIIGGGALDVTFDLKLHTDIAGAGFQFDFITLSGAGDGSSGLGFNMPPTEVTTPIPAALWMVGSALVAGFPVLRRRTSKEPKSVA